MIGLNAKKKKGENEIRVFAWTKSKLGSVVNVQRRSTESLMSHQTSGENHAVPPDELKEAISRISSA